MATALITGSSSGIGLATAIRLAADGHRVLATMRDPSRDGDLRAAASAAGVSLDVRQLDVDDDRSVTEAFARIASDVGPVDILVNNAGTSPVAAVEDMPLRQWKELFETNFFGVIRCVQAVLPAMRAQRSGSIINISSIAGRVAVPIFGPYAASKFALEAATESLACEAAIFGIRVHLVEPGAVVTPIRAKTGAPDRNSPYRPVAKNWGFSMGYDHARARGPEEVADVISRAVSDPATAFRITVGAGVDELIALRRRHDDEAWIELWSSETPEFLRRYQELTGLDVTAPPPDATPSMDSD